MVSGANSFRRYFVVSVLGRFVTLFRPFRKLIFLTCKTVTKTRENDTKYLQGGFHVRKS